MATPLALDTGRLADATIVLTVTGEIDLSNVDAFKDALVAAVGDADGTKVTVDLAAVDYLDSGGVNVLFANAEHIRVLANPLLLPILAVSGLTRVVTVEPQA